MLTHISSGVKVNRESVYILTWDNDVAVAQDGELHHTQVLSPS